MTGEEVYKAVGVLWNDHDIMRSVFQFLRPEIHIDHWTIYAAHAGGETAYASIHLNQAITASFVDENNARAHRLNHAFVVALWAIMEDFNESRSAFIKGHNRPGEPWAWLKLCELLRSVAGHGQRGRYFEGDAPKGAQGKTPRWHKNSKALLKLMRELLHGDEPLEASLRNGHRHFNFSKPDVLAPLRDGCLRCVDAWLADHPE
jgi:hypothetical protein